MPPTPAKLTVPATMAVPSWKCYINSGIVMAFKENDEDDGLKQQREDYLNSLLFAQLAANVQQKRESNPDTWYNIFISLLKDIGWILNDSQFLDVSLTGHPSFEMPTIAVNHLEQNGSSAEEVECFRKGISAVHNLSDNDPLIEHLQKCMGSITASLILASFEVKKKEMELKLSMFVLEASGETEHISLPRVFESKEVVFRQVKLSKMILNIGIFESVRSAIREKLGDRVNSMISELIQV